MQCICLAHSIPGFTLLPGDANNTFFFIAMSEVHRLVKKNWGSRIGVGDEGAGDLNDLQETCCHITIPPKKFFTPPTEVPQQVGGGRAICRSEVMLVVSPRFSLRDECIGVLTLSDFMSYSLSKHVDYNHSRDH